MPYRQLSRENKEMFLREIEEMKSKILQKKHEIVKINFNKKNIQESLELSIATEKNKILSAQEMINEYQFNLDNRISFTELGVLESKAEQDIQRQEKNIQARELQIRQGVLENPTRDEKAREKLKKRIAEEHQAGKEADENGQSEIEEAGQQESIDAEA